MVQMQDISIPQLIQQINKYDKSIALLDKQLTEIEEQIKTLKSNAEIPHEPKILDKSI